MKYPDNNTHNRTLLKAVGVTVGRNKVLYKWAKKVVLHSTKSDS